MKEMIKGLFLLIVVASSSLVFAEQVETRGDYKIHYSAFSSTVLKPEISSHYQLVRSRFQGVINIAVLKAEGKSSKAHTAVVNGITRNLLGQTQKVKFKEIREGDAIYYLGSFRFNNQEMLSFDVKVQPDPNKDPYTVKFQKKFYAD
jgi:hypothetical protein